MKFFDYFINKHKKEKTKKEDNLSFSISQTTNNMFDGISVDGDTLRKVYPQNIQNGVFIIPKYIKSIGMFAFSNLEDL
ncbi:MAG: hypothetical protein IJX26_00625, partial [Clostridia bacterium]|nr:hypothetical protein [Clostridia bacterium]